MLLKWKSQCFTKAIYVGAQNLLLFMIINIMVINNNNKWNEKKQRTNNDIVHLYPSDYHKYDLSIH